MAGVQSNHGAESGIEKSEKGSDRAEKAASERVQSGYTLEDSAALLKSQLKESSAQANDRRLDFSRPARKN